MNLLQEKLSRELVIFDGAIGTEIYRHNFFVNTSYEQLSLTRPDIIRDIHRRYLEAGAEVLTTNTFNANARKLAKFGLSDQTAAINRAATAIAREIAGGKALVAASAGPVGQPESQLDRRGAAEILQEQILNFNLADFIIFESLRTTQDLQTALTAIRDGSRLPYMLSLAIEPGEDFIFRIADTMNLITLAVESGLRPPTAVGLNCGRGPEQILEVAEHLSKVSPYPVVVQPNAGAPRNIDGRTIYMNSGEYFSTYARRYQQLGVKGIGGCCGITPEEIAEMAKSVKPLDRAEHAVLHLSEAVLSQLPEPPSPAECSELGAKLAAGKFIKTVEITPPRGFDLAKTLAGAELCRQAGIDAVNLPDGPRASARITPLAAAAEIERNCHIATIPHCCCRDRSLIGLQSELLSYAALGIKNILFITGDPPKLGSYRDSSGVFDLDSIGLVKMQKMMNRGIDAAGEKLNTPTRTLIGVGADPNALDLERELDRLAQKAAAGADFIMTQPVFEPERLLSFLKRIADLKLPVIAGVWPLTSLRNAQFMKTEVPGVYMPDEVLHRMALSDNRDAQREMGIAIAKENLRAIRPYVQGVQVNAPFGNVNLALQVLADL